MAIVVFHEVDFHKEYILEATYLPFLQQACDVACKARCVVVPYEYKGIKMATCKVLDDSSCPEELLSITRVPIDHAQQLAEVVNAMYKHHCHRFAIN